MITSISELKANRDIIHQIDWDMTPEKAIDMYLEWGASWCRGKDFVGKWDDTSIYFVIYDWETPKVTLLKRTTKDVEELAKIPAEMALVLSSIDESGQRAGVGVAPPNRELKMWLSEALDGPPVPN